MTAMRPTLSSLGALVFALSGFVFSSVSTHDFAAHLDRQVHGVHCSFLPGLGAADASGTSGCHLTLMSPYSSVWRDSVWGGVPVSLPGMSVFAFLTFFALALVVGRRQRDPNAAAFLLAATLLPVGASIVMGRYAMELDAACKLCIGTYISSFGCFVSAFLGFLGARREPSTEAEPLKPGWLAAAFVLGVMFVVIPVRVYMSSAPDFSKYVGQCGELLQQQDPNGVLVPLGPQDSSLGMIEVLDPLCPACKGFEERFSAMPASTEVSRKALLFPLDPTCNWMVSDAIHPGACTLSEAILCAGDDAESVLEWSFAEHDPIMEATKQDPAAAARLVKAQFPRLASCIGSASAKSRLNQALRWAVKNQLRVLTPQVFVRGLRLCDEDTDLGLDYALPRLMEKARNRTVPEALPAEPGADLTVARARPPVRPAGQPGARPEIVNEAAPAADPAPAPAPEPAPEAAAEPAPAADPAAEPPHPVDLPVPPEGAP